MAGQRAARKQPGSGERFCFDPEETPHGLCRQLMATVPSETHSSQSSRPSHLASDYKSQMRRS